MAFDRDTSEVKNWMNMFRWVVTCPHHCAQFHHDTLPRLKAEWIDTGKANADLKHAIGAAVPVRTKAKLKSAAESHMALLQQTPDRVRTYFQDQRTRHAAKKLLNAGSITAGWCRAAPFLTMCAEGGLQIGHDATNRGSKPIPAIGASRRS
jgi:hypothetical protein